MDTAIVISAVVMYFYGVARLLRWAAVRAGRDQPSWWDAISYVFLPRLAGRITEWVIPNSWAWPEKWIGLGIWFIMFPIVVFAVVRVRLVDGLLVWSAAIVSMLMTLWTVLPHLKAVQTTSPPTAPALP